MISVALLPRYGSATPVALYVLVTAVVTCAAVGLSRETAHTELDDTRGAGHTSYPPVDQQAGQSSRRLTDR